ncbi:MAG: Holliday junction resolvase RuvX [Caldisericia bacterium]|jgi:putative Holliday junction resolvase|nr:Holliday junction resolvase RuvX [Caldisericia bacterium]
MKRILGVDWGEKKMGVSISDELKISANGIGVFYGDFEEKLKVLKELTEKYEIEKIVLGIPISLSGEINKEGEKILKVKDEIEKRLRIQVELIDERFTTKIAKERFSFEKKKRQKIKEKKIQDDLTSAIIILNSYLERIK